ncbi:hypothetical protein, partial [Pseudomonas oryzihabitans]|uniref:hypothetical protein n=1 Tax=Pseudomonas oryzihabitans TaxID=47885 RepID=UPI001C93079A
SGRLPPSPKVSYGSTANGSFGSIAALQTVPAPQRPSPNCSWKILQAVAGIPGRHRAVVVIAISYRSYFENLKRVVAALVGQGRVYFKNRQLGRAKHRRGFLGYQSANQLISVRIKRDNLATRDVLVVQKLESSEVFRLIQSKLHHDHG